MRCALAVLVLTCAPGPALAQESPWARALAGDEERAARRLVEDGIRRMACAIEPSRCPEETLREIAWQEAAARFERAAEHLDDDDIRFLAAFTRTRGLPPHPDADSLAQCIALFEALREERPDYAPARVAFELALLRTRAGDMPGAVEEYGRVERARGLPSMPSASPLVGWELVLLDQHEPIPAQGFYGNWAEVSMLAGDAEAAAARYRRAIELAGASTFSGALATWGLALAEERMGDHVAALEAACAAIDIGLPDEYPALAAARAEVRARWGPFAALHDADVFFEPASEVRAYEALGHECLASRSASAEGRAAQRERARASWRYFLLEGGAEGPWAASARTAEARLGSP